MTEESSSSNCWYDTPPSSTVATNCSHGTFGRLASRLNSELVSLDEVLASSVSVFVSLVTREPNPEVEDESVVSVDVTHESEFVVTVDVTDESEFDLRVLVSIGVGNLHLVRKLS